MPRILGMKKRKLFQLRETLCRYSSARRVMGDGHENMQFPLPRNPGHCILRLLASQTLCNRPWARFRGRSVGRPVMQ